MPPIAARDQSYFLFATTAEQLAFVRFPLGELPKAETRGLAARLACRWRRSPTARTSASFRPATIRPWSAGCGPRRLRPGEIVDRAGAVARPPWRHRPLSPWASGAGLGVAAGERLYVVGIDAAEPPGDRGAAPRRGLRQGRARRGQLAGAAGRRRHGRGQAPRQRARRRARRSSARSAARPRCASPSRRSAWLRARPASSIAAPGSSAAAGSPRPRSWPRLDTRQGRPLSHRTSVAE